MGLDKVVARRLADEYFTRWRAGATYAELIRRDEELSSEDIEVTEGGVTYRVTLMVWRETGDTAYTMAVKVGEARRRGLFRGSVIRTGRMHSDGSFTEDR